MATTTESPFPRRRPRLSDRALGVVLAALYVALLLATTDIGFPRDESFYFKAGRDYAGWFEELEQNHEVGRIEATFEQGPIDKHWAYNPEHPVLMKTLFGLSEVLFHEELGWMSASTAMRFPAMLFAGWLIALIFRFALDITGRRLAAFAAAAAMALQPRFFFHAHLACFDVPITTLWVAVIYAYWRSWTSTGWAWATGLLWGIALITKLNAFFLPIVMVLHWLGANAGAFRLDRGLRLRLPKIPTAWLSMAVLGPLIFYYGWPRHWYDTYGRIKWYLGFHLEHEHYFVNYFGESLFAPPFPVSFPFVMTATTTPVMILAAALVGLGLFAWDRLRFAWRGAGVDVRGTGWLIALNIAFPFLLIANPDTPIFGGVKHWFPAIPFLMIALGVFVAAVVGQIERATATLRPMTGRVVAGVGALAVVLSILAPASYGVRTNHPFGTSYYNELIGGHTGAADRHAMRQFWGYASRQALPWLNENADSGARVAFHNTTYDAYAMYKEEGLLRDDIRFAWGIDDADWVLYHHQESFAELQASIWSHYGSVAPAHTVTVAGVPLVSVYGNPRRTPGRDAGLGDPDDRSWPWAAPPAPSQAGPTSPEQGSTETRRKR